MSMPHTPYKVGCCLESEVCKFFSLSYFLQYLLVSLLDVFHSISINEALII